MVLKALRSYREIPKIHMVDNNVENILIELYTGLCTSIL